MKRKIETVTQITVLGQGGRGGEPLVTTCLFVCLFFLNI